MYLDEYKRWLAADLEDADLKPELRKIEGNDEEIEKALVFYGYLNELPEDELLSGNYSHEKIKKGLKMVAEHYGILNVIDLIYR